MYKIFAWPLAKKYGSDTDKTAYRGIEAMLKDPEKILKETQLPEEFWKILVEIAEDCMKPEQKIIQSRAELQITKVTGIDGVHKILKEAKANALNQLSHEEKK